MATGGVFAARVLAAPGGVAVMVGRMGCAGSVVDGVVMVDCTGCLTALGGGVVAVGRMAGRAGRLRGAGRVGISSDRACARRTSAMRTTMSEAMNAKKTNAPISVAPFELRDSNGRSNATTTATGMSAPPRDVRLPDLADRSTERRVATMKKRKMRGKSSMFACGRCATHATRYRRMMIRVLAFVGVPLLEFALLIWVEGRLGLGVTLALVVMTGMVGAAMVSRQGSVVWRSFRYRVSTGQVPDLEIAHGMMLIVAGAFLVTPGILTDTIGLALLVPWVRELVRVRFLSSVRVVVR